MLHSSHISPPQPHIRPVHRLIFIVFKVTKDVFQLSEGTLVASLLCVVHFLNATLSQKVFLA